MRYYTIYVFIYLLNLLNNDVTQITQTTETSMTVRWIIRTRQSADAAGTCRTLHVHCTHQMVALFGVKWPPS